ncbi:tetratricopeptide repeat protein [Xinfangfangia sp. D13-10-4-6]|uniref:tetratricopeptide repeat protein n=1 Tax=Pseudogemmobacter hezensis TaxID=2737662 RepID=UPI001551A8AA|nr:tetratricopeptide repeat protein [Pseudogemmobacter hezensis]NPD17014.1 tetratricopeptide repeat protein [Pseudogemmobacter hezensis]
MSALNLFRSLLLLLLATGSGCALSGDEAIRSRSETEQIAEAARSVGEYEEAARLFERAAERDPQSVNALIGLGRTYTELGQFNRAANALNTASAKRPRNAEIYAEMGRLALYQGQASEALVQYDTALKHDRRSLQALTGRAVSLDYLSRHAEAQQGYQQALKIYPTNFALLSNNALSMVISGDAAQGVAVLEELSRDSQHLETAKANLAIT